MGEDGGGGEDVSKLAAGKVAEEKLFAPPLIMSVARVMGYAVAYFIQQVAHWPSNQGDGANHDRYVIGGAAG